MKRWSVLSALILSVAVAIPCRAAEEKLDLPIEVFQALREGVKGVAFENEPVRIGLPFPRGMVKETGGRPALSVAGKGFQCRTLKRWPDGSVKWGLVQFLASPDKEKSEDARLVNGGGAGSGAQLARERDGKVEVDTGPMQVTVDRSRSAFIDTVTVQGKELVRAGDSRGIILVDGTGREFAASRCPDTRISIEENGPVAATVRIDGGHCNGSERLLAYTTRLFFAKGQCRIKVQYTLKNASKKSPRHAFIKSLSLETALTGPSPQTAIVSLPKGEKEFDPGQGEIRYYQAVSGFPWMNDGDSFYYHGPIPPDPARDSQRGYLQEGFQLKQSGRLVDSGKRNEFPDLGYLDISDRSGRGVTVGVRYMAGNWPKALGVNASGTVRVSLWPEENDQGYWIRFGSHTTFDVMYSFHVDQSKKPSDEMKRFQYPLVARAPVEWYNQQVEGIYPLYHFIRFSDEERIAKQLKGGNSIGWRKPKFQVWRNHYWGHGAFLNQHDFGRIAQVNFLRDDRSRIKAGEYALSAEAIFNYYADWSVYHSDDFDSSRTMYEPKENKIHADLPKVVFEWEHQHWYGMPLYYYMTGDERIREAVIDLGEYLKGIASPLSLTYMRVFGTGMFSLAAMYEFTGDTSYMLLANKNFERLLNAKFNNANPYANIYIDWERGVVAGGSGSGWEDNNPGVKVDLMMGSLLYDGILNYHQNLEESSPMKEKSRSLLLKMSEFMLREPYFEGSKDGRWAMWLPYVFNLKDREKSRHSYKLIGQASFWVTYPYELAGEDRWLTMMKKMAKMSLWDDSGVWGSYGYMDHPGFQTIGYYVLRDSSLRQSH